MKWTSGDSDNMIAISKTYLIQMTGTGQEKDKKYTFRLTFSDSCSKLMLNDK